MPAPNSLPADAVLSSLLFWAANRNQLDLLFAQLDFKLIAWLGVEHGGVCLAHQLIAVAPAIGTATTQRDLCGQGLGEHLLLDESRPTEACRVSTATSVQLQVLLV